VKRGLRAETLTSLHPRLWQQLAGKRKPALRINELTASSGRVYAECGSRVGAVMRSTIFATAFTFLLWGIPAFAADSDADGVEDEFDNCSEAVNYGQDDTDGDDCGNLCDADYDDDGVVGHSDVFRYAPTFGTVGNEEQCHNEPIPGCIVGLPDFGFLIGAFGKIPGPSGTTAGTTACP
jgi:hypothetical protein